MIVQVGNEWRVYNEKRTRILGRYKTYAEAITQLRAIEVDRAAKERALKHARDMKGSKKPPFTNKTSKTAKKCVC